MGYPKDLDEYTDEQLQGELRQRRKDRDEGKCDYCHRHYTTGPCRFKERHTRAGERFYKGWRADDFNSNWITAESEDKIHAININRYNGSTTLFNCNDGMSNQVDECKVKVGPTDRLMFEAAVDWAESRAER